LPPLARQKGSTADGDRGDLLLQAVADVTVDGQRLEGVGVTPTIEVPFNPIYAAGRDPQLERAVQVLSDRIKG
jgi:carboxyl-terminal processing protease